MSARHEMQASDFPCLPNEKKIFLGPHGPDHLNNGGDDHHKSYKILGAGNKSIPCGEVLLAWFDHDSHDTENDILPFEVNSLNREEIDW